MTFLHQPTFSHHRPTEVGREARSSKIRGRERPNTSRKGFKAMGKGRLWRRLGKRLLSEGSGTAGKTQPGEGVVEEGAEGGAVKKGRASASTTAKEACASNVADQASASTTA